MQRQAEKSAFTDVTSRRLCFFFLNQNIPTIYLTLQAIFFSHHLICFNQLNFFWMFSSKPEVVVSQSGSERTSKRTPGKITRAIKVSLVGDGTVGTFVCFLFLTANTFKGTPLINSFHGKTNRKNMHANELHLPSLHFWLHSNNVWQLLRNWNGWWRACQHNFVGYCWYLFRWQFFFLFFAHCWSFLKIALYVLNHSKSIVPQKNKRPRRLRDYSNKNVFSRYPHLHRLLLGCSSRFLFECQAKGIKVFLHFEKQIAHHRIVWDSFQNPFHLLLSTFDF